jgi:hypothetical protein
MLRRTAGGFGVLALVAACFAGAATAHADGLDDPAGGPELDVSPLYYAGDYVQTAVGDVYKAPLGIVNRGTDAQGVLLEMDVTAGLDFVTKYSNCEYATVPKRTTSSQDTWTQPVTEALCEIKGTFGADLYGQLGEPVQLTVTKQALADDFHYQVFEDTAAALASARGSADFTRGTGPALAMGPLETIHSDAGGNATDTWFGDTGDARFETHGTADFAARGGAVSGRVGDTVKAVVGYTNEGPAWFGAANTLTTGLTFRVPDGAQVVDKPAACRKTSAEQAAAEVYTCSSHASVSVGQSVSYAFALKIVKVVRKASGSVTAGPPPMFEDASYSADKNPANDTAPFVLTGKPAKSGRPGSGGSGSGGSGGSGTAAGGGNAPGAQGQGSELADTGATGVGTIGGGALAVLAAGGGLWALSRRRRAQA